MKTIWKKMTLLASLGLVFAMSATGAPIDTSKSGLNWTGTKVTGKHFGELRFKSGDVQVKNGKLTGGEFVVDVNSLSVTDLEGEWADKFLSHMKSGDFFEVKKYPTSTLKIKKVDGSKVSADLTIKGKTHPITFNYSKSNGNYVGNFKFDRTKYDMVYNSGNFFKDLGDKMIHDEVSVDFKIVPME